jgi:hypothetical protein
LCGRKVRYCSALAPSGNGRRSADVAQLVERNLAKVEVAGSNPVVRSERVRRASFLSGGVAERRGNGLQSRVHGFESRLHLENLSGLRVSWTIGAAVARFPDTEEVTGSIPVSSTKAMGDSCPRRARSGSPSSFVRRRCACRERGLRHPHPLFAFASLGCSGWASRLADPARAGRRVVRPARVGWCRVVFAFVRFMGMMRFTGRLRG